MYAALGDATRLTIIDRLSAADASPGELAAELGLASNLLAHHLGVLNDAELVRKVRSEGDRRRTYLQLRLDDTAVARVVAAGELAPLAATRVVFVCTHNSARSQLAAAAWRRASAVPAASAGTCPAVRVHPRAIAVGRRHGLRLGRARTALVDHVLEAADLVVAVCDNAHERLPPADRLHWAVPDPVRLDTDAAFEAAYVELTRRIDRLAALVEPTTTGGAP
jgi:protein-tyrosine-phosphatase